MRKLLAAAILASVPLAGIAMSPANASVISIGACVPGTLGTPCAPTTLVSGLGPIQGLPTLGDPVGAFTITGSASATTSTTTATFNSNTIQITTTGDGGLIDIYFTVSQVPTVEAPLVFTSNFTSNSQVATTHSVIESTWEDNGDGVYALVNQLGTATLNNSQNESIGPIVTALTPTAGMVSLTELYQVQLQGCGGGSCSGDLTIFLTAQQVPEPTTLAIFGTALVGLGAVMRRRRRQGDQI